MNTFNTNVPQFETEYGDKILYPFSPPIFQTEVDDKFTKELIEEGRKLNIKDNDWNHKLAGNLKYGRSFAYKEEYLDRVEPYLKKYVERFFSGLIKQNNLNRPTVDRNMIISIMEVCRDRQKFEEGTLKLDTLWINFSQKHDFNPPHTHAGVLSFVIFCKVPEKIFSVQADSNSQVAGNIVFEHGEQISKLHGCEYPVEPYENLMFIFPAELKHFVPAYWVDEERISVSGNFVVV